MAPPRIEALPSDRVVLSDTCSLPAADFVEGRYGVIGQSGRGKSGLLKVIEEELTRLHLPFVVFDPAGIAWGLRSSADAKSPGLPILVIGGEHGDLPLNRHAGAEVAEAIVKANVSAIIDFSQEPKAAYRQFLADFCHRLYAINNSPRLVIIDEAKEVLPQSVRNDQAVAYDAVERLIRQGRNRAIGVIIVSQRAATVNKDALTQCGTLVVFGLVGAPDRKALKEWVEAWATRKQLAEFEAGLASLERRDCYVWSPQDFGIFQKIRVREFHTLHPDKTHLRRAGLLQVRPSTTDVSAIVESLGTQLSTIKAERAELADVPKLRSQVTRLTRELEAERAKPRATAASKAELDRAVREATEPLKGQVAGLTRESVAGRKVIEEARMHLERAARTLGSPLTAETTPMLPQRPQASPLAVTRPRIEPRAQLKAGAEGEERELPTPTGGALRMLRVLASIHPESVSRTNLGAMAEIAPNSGTFSDYLSLLRRAELAEDLTGGSVRATDAGLAYFAQRPDRLTQEELANSARGRVSGGARRMMDVLLAEYPGSITRQELGERAGIAPNSGTFSDYLSMLRRLGLVKVEGSDVTAAQVLFP